MSALNRFVPQSKAASAKLIEELQSFLDKASSLVVMTGAGISTESGIPDYRSSKTGQYARSKEHQPIQHLDFMTNEFWRRRYWARNFLAHNRFSSAQFNANHEILAEWEQSKRFNWLITQNVDGLHTSAGSKKVTELHGCAKKVVCMTCKQTYLRADFQEILLDLNPDWRLKQEQVGELAPDADSDAVVGINELANFKLPYCLSCGDRSILKTDVVFFGDNVPRTVVDECYEKIDSADALLVLGSSLTVMSGYRFVYYAESKMPVAILSIGPTRADHLATLKLDTKSSDVLKQLKFT
ncbi:NAD-dependent protein deacylase [Aphelenchoides bicaudatus]|nr:NAD-dependent protein deacylase [Aphelenchoides bicaudatus]